MRLLWVRFFSGMLFLALFSVVFSAAQAVAKDNRGQAVFGLCLQCHGPEGQGNPLFEAPRIAGLPEWYLIAQLEKFKSGVRGMHPNDDAGNKMRPMARAITDADIKSVAAYVSALKPSTPNTLTLVGGNAEKGKAYYAVCAACHGANADGNETLHAPPIKLTSDWYLVRQLKNFKSKMRAADPAKDPVGATMAPQAAAFADEQAMKDVITYIQSLR